MLSHIKHLPQCRRGKSRREISWETMIAVHVEITLEEEIDEINRINK